MKAVKGNKVYTIDESEKARYIAMGYDITDGKEVIAYGKGKTVAYDKYVAAVKEKEILKEKLEAENEALKVELEALKQKVSSADEVDKKATANADKTEKKTTNKSAKE